MKPNPNPSPVPNIPGTTNHRTPGYAAGTALFDRAELNYDRANHPSTEPDRTGSTSFRDFSFINIVFNCCPNSVPPCSTGHLGAAQPCARRAPSAKCAGVPDRGSWSATSSRASCMSAVNSLSMNSFTSARNDSSAGLNDRSKSPNRVLFRNLP